MPTPLIQLEPSEIQRFTKPHVSRDDIHAILQFKPRNLDFYRRALVHKSVLRLIKYLDPNKVPKYMIESNERLEFLGDSVLGLITADFLYKKFPDKDEGFLTTIRSKLVNTNALSNFAEKLGLEQHILMSKHLQRLDKRNKINMLENAFEALIGAIYEDTNLEYARKFILNVFSTFVDWETLLIDTNYKDQMLRFCQTKKLSQPEYEVVSTSGPAHDRSFVVQVLIGGEVYGKGEKKQKQAAEQSAARQALINLTGGKLTK